MSLLVAPTPRSSGMAPRQPAGRRGRAGRRDPHRAGRPGFVDGEVIESRGLTIDESLLTGESDGIRKQTRTASFSGAFALALGYYEADAVRRGQLRREGCRGADLPPPPSPLQEEVNGSSGPRRSSSYRSGSSSPVSLRRPRHAVPGGCATAPWARHADPGGPRAADERHARGGRRPPARQNTLVQQMAATEGLPPSTRSVDKTGTLTDGELELVAVFPADGDGRRVRARARPLRELGRRAQPDAPGDRRPGRATPEPVAAEVPFSSAWKWSGVTLNGSGERKSYVMGPPTSSSGPACCSSRPSCRRRSRSTSASRRVVAFGEAAGGLPSDPSSQPPRLPAALVVLEERFATTPPRRSSSCASNRWT